MAPSNGYFSLTKIGLLAVGNDRRVKSIEEIDGSVEEVEGSLGQHLRCSENIQDIDVKGNNLQLTSVYKD
ncbi:hypothetical protein L195_g015382, partial [Trifolium pratense]